MPKKFQWLNKETAKSLCSSINFLLLDVDGVVLVGNKLIPSIHTTLGWFKSHGIQIRFITNNSSISRKQTCAKLQALGLDVQEEEIYNSGYVTSLYLLNSSPKEDLISLDGRTFYGKDVFVIGESGLHHELRQVLAPNCVTYGLECNNTKYDINLIAEARVSNSVPQRNDNLYNHLQVLPETDSQGHNKLCSLKDFNFGAVVIGVDFHLNLTKIALASILLQEIRADEEMAVKDSLTLEENKNANQYAIRFIATNDDPQIPVGSNATKLPGAGVGLSALKVASGRSPEAVCGKPNPELGYTLAKKEKIGIDFSHCLMVGDRLSTDIAFGNRLGCRTLFVLTGCEGESDLQEAVKSSNDLFIPTFVANSLSDLQALSIV